MKGGRTRHKYQEAEPVLTESGIGKNYKGFRIFHPREKDSVHLIGNAYSERKPTGPEMDQFRKDLAKAANSDRKIARYLEEFPQLKVKESGSFKPEPETITKTG